jgi:hypothetical protein
MRYLNSTELSQFHDAFLAMCERHATAQNEEGWGFPTGVIYCDTYSFTIRQNTLYIGHDATVAEDRWWIPIGLESQAYINELAIAFEMNIPRTTNMRLSVHYGVEDNRRIHILHKGKVTVGHGSLGMSEFFSYYRNNPGRWPIIRFYVYEYLGLGQVSLPITDGEFLGLVESLAEFASYISAFKDNYR